jgi:hypothetical protein
MKSVVLCLISEFFFDFRLWASGYFSGRKGKGGVAIRKKKNETKKCCKIS